jgi:hypothetical protein
VIVREIRCVHATQQVRVVRQIAIVVVGRHVID